MDLHTLRKEVLLGTSFDQDQVDQDIWKDRVLLQQMHHFQDGYWIANEYQKMPRNTSD